MTSNNRSTYFSVDKCLENEAKVCNSEEVTKLFSLRSLKEKVEFMCRGKSLHADQTYAENTTNHKRR